MPAYVIRHAGYRPNRVLQALDALEGKAKPAKKAEPPAETKAAKPAKAAKRPSPKKKAKRK